MVVVHPRALRCDPKAAVKNDNNKKKDDTLLSTSYRYYWQRPLGAAHGVMRLTQVLVLVVVESKRSSYYPPPRASSGVWARPLSIDQVEQDIATGLSSVPITTLQVVFQTCYKSSAAAASARGRANPKNAAAEEVSTVSSSWIRVCRALQRRCRGNIPAVHFLGNNANNNKEEDNTAPLVVLNEDAHWAVLLQHLFWLRRTTTTTIMPAVHVCHANHGGRRTLQVLADAMDPPPPQQPHPSGSTSTTPTTTKTTQQCVLRELVLRNCRALADANEGESLRRIVPHLERWKLLDGTTILGAGDEEEDAYRWWWQWTEQNCPHTAITWQVTRTPFHEQSAGCTIGRSTTSSCRSHFPNDIVEDTNKSTTTLVPSHPNTTILKQQQQQQLWQDYLDWNCSLNEWRWHWLKPFRLARQREHNSDHHNSELVEAVCVVLKAWYRTHHRPAHTDGY